MIQCFLKLLCLRVQKRMPTPPMSLHVRELLTPFLMQGVTTIAGGNYGFSPYPVHELSKQIVYENCRFLAEDSFASAWQPQEEFKEDKTVWTSFLEHLKASGLREGSCLSATRAWDWWRR